MVVPGPPSVKREAEAKGLDRVFRDCRLAWRSLLRCRGRNGDRGEPGERIVSTTNRNFENGRAPSAHAILRAGTAAAPSDRPHTDVRQLLVGSA